MERGTTVLDLATRRRSIRKYSDGDVDLRDVLYAISAALQAPSGANRQPWRFIIVSDKELKQRIREVCERAEREFYESTSLPEWFLKWARERGITWRKEFLTEAPFLIVVISDKKQPYAKESTWLAVGYLLLALEERGLASLTYTPSNAREVLELLQVPNEYELETIIPVGRAAEDKRKEKRKKLSEMVFLNKWGNAIPDDRATRG
ncbi:MAG: nitroreductase family protein [Candidatus Baldrarchaeia archaeon]